VRDATVTWLGMVVVLRVLCILMWPWPDLWSRSFELRQFLAKPCVLAAMTAAPLWGFLVFVCASNVSGTAKQICTKFIWKTCLVPRSDEFECRGQRLRSPGTKLRKLLRHPHWQCIVRRALYAANFVQQQRLLDNSRIANSRTGHLADWLTRGLDNSRTGQLADSDYVDIPNH